MDRIPATTGGALGGSRATAAGATAGVPPGRLGERQVSVAPESPRPLPGQGHGTGNGVASLARPGSRAGRGPSRVAPGSAADAPGTSFGAGAAGDARGRPRNLPEPSPKPSYRYKWNRFVLCCKERNLQWWPASPETVADYLEDCAAKYGSQALLRSIRRAIANTHTKAGLADPCATRVVEATYDELIETKGGVVSQSKNITGRSLDAAQLDSIRAAAFYPRRHGRVVESDETVRQRVQVTLALCSLVLEAGLQCDEAAALEWRDLRQDENGAPAVAIRKGSADADHVVAISSRALEDLNNIAPKHAAPDAKIFVIDARQIAMRIWDAARGTRLESRIIGTAPRQGVHGIAAGPSAETVSIRGGHWWAFCAWCDWRGIETLPARAETVAEFLREYSKVSTVGTVNNKRYAIRHVHLRAGHADPCATPLVEATMRDVRRTGAGFSPKSLNPAALAAIRASVMTRGIVPPCGSESVAAARNRGLVDIALCSVVHAAGLSVKQAVALKWRDVEIPGKDEAKLTVKSGTDDHGSAEIRRIAGQAVRDLEAIRGDARPEDSVFGFTVPQAYRHIKEAARHAGLVVGGEPSTAGSWHMAPAGSWHTAPAGPSHTAPADP